MITKYDIIHEKLQERVDNGELTVEDAEAVDELAYEKYADVEVEEASDYEDEEDEEDYDDED